jgi:hypothetical protein
MRDRIARAVLFGFGVLGVGAGVLELFGFGRLERAASILVGIAAIAGGITMTRHSRGPNPRIGDPEN